MEFLQYSKVNKLHRPESLRSSLSGMRRPPWGSPNGTFPMATIIEQYVPENIKFNNGFMETIKKQPRFASDSGEQSPRVVPHAGLPLTSFQDSAPRSPGRLPTKMMPVYATLNEQHFTQSAQISNRKFDTSEMPVKKQKYAANDNCNNPAKATLDSPQSNGREAGIYLDVIKTKQWEHKLAQRRKRKACLCRLITVVLFVGACGIFPYAVVQALSYPESRRGSAKITGSDIPSTVMFVPTQKHLSSSPMAHNSSTESTNYTYLSKTRQPTANKNVIRQTTPRKKQIFSATSTISLLRTTTISSSPSGQTTRP